MVELQNYSFSYTVNKQTLKNINLKIHQGEFVVITGLSGCGKTSLTRVLNGLCPNFYQGKVQGKYKIYGKNAGNMSISELSKYWGSVFQDPRSQFLAKRVKDELVLAMENACESRDSMKEKLDSVVKYLGIENLLDREMMFLSSGEKQKIAIGSVFCTYPKGFVLDEPSANLDSTATRELAGFLKQVKEKGHTVVISEHRLYYLKDLIDRLIIMRDGEIVREISGKDINLLDDVKINKLGLRMLDVPKIRAGEDICGDSGFISCKGIKCIKDSLIILNDIDAYFEAGRVHAILGENGAGKSSLCKVITGLYRESSGNVFINNSPIKPKKRFSKTFFVLQDIDYQLYGYSIRNEFQIGRSKVSDKEIEECLESINLKLSLDTNPQILSGGQKQRLLIGTAYLSGKDIIVLDEPTSGLDGFHMRKISKIIRELANKGKTIIVITHDMEFVSESADTILYIGNGNIQYHKYLS